jgi:hypothetical protein
LLPSKVTLETEQFLLMLRVELSDGFRECGLVLGVSIKQDLCMFELLRFKLFIFLREQLVVDLEIGVPVKFVKDFSHFISVPLVFMV